MWKKKVSAWECFKLKKKRIKVFVNKIKRGSLFWKRSHLQLPKFFFFQIELVCFIFLYKFWWLQSQKTDLELIYNYESPQSKKTPKFWRKTIFVTFLVVIHFFQNLPAFEKSYFMRHFRWMYVYMTQINFFNWRFLQSFVEIHFWNDFGWTPCILPNDVKLYLW
jgi:hypothetical protein